MFAKNGLLLSSLMSSWQIRPFIFCSMAEANRGGWAQLQDTPTHTTSQERGAIPTASVLFRRFGLLFVKRRGPQQMLCSTSRLDPYALTFQRWRSLRWDICTVHPLSQLGGGPRGCRLCRARAFKVSHLCSSTRMASVSSSAGKPKFHSSLCKICLLKT